MYLHRLHQRGFKINPRWITSYYRHNINQLYQTYISLNYIFCVIDYLADTKFHKNSVTSEQQNFTLFLGSIRDETAGMYIPQKKYTFLIFIPEICLYFAKNTMGWNSVTKTAIEIVILSNIFKALTLKNSDSVSLFTIQSSTIFFYYSVVPPFIIWFHLWLLKNLSVHLHLL